MSLIRHVASKLVLRIYLVGILEFALVSAAFFAMAVRSRPPPALSLVGAQFMASSVAAAVDDPRALADIVGRAEQLRWAVAVYDEHGALVAHTNRLPQPGGDALAGEIPLESRAGRPIKLLYEAPRFPPPPRFGFSLAIVLVVVGVASWIMARSLTRPLLRLSSAARAFGRGDIHARVGAMPWSGELGEVSVAFDEMADRVTRALRAERELLANVSHELRTPLQRIRIALDIAAEGDERAARESLGDMAEDLAELERIVEDVLIAARLSLEDGVGRVTAAPPSRRGPVEVRALLDKSATRFRAAHRRPLALEIAPALPSVDADAVLLRRVVDNLLDNANKYTEAPDAAVTVRAFAEGASVVMEVIDRGIGMSQADLDRAFEPFFRADRSRTRATGGLGLGLALSRRIVEAHGGTLSLSSALGKGSTARIVLPVPAPSAP